jgi:hypothetical protein
MNAEPLFVIRVVFFVMFLVSLASGLLLFRNFGKMFGSDKAQPSENHSSRSLNAIQVSAMWLMCVILTGALAFFLK